MLASVVLRDPMRSSKNVPANGLAGHMLVSAFTR